jgi:hypothetical protein
MNGVRREVLFGRVWCAWVLGLLADTVLAASITPESLELPSINSPSAIDVETATLVTDALSKQQRTHVLVSLKTIPSPASRRSLERLGIRLLSYLGEKTWLASVSNPRVLKFNDADTVARYPNLAGIRGIGLLQPKDKISRQLRGRLGDWAYTADGKVKLTVRGFADADLNGIKAHLEKHGAIVLGEVAALKVVGCAVDASRVQALADHNDIRWIAPMPPLGPGEAGRIRNHIGVNEAQSDYRLSGNGVTVGIFEAGHAYPSHRDFSRPTRLAVGDADTLDFHYHPTQTAGVIGGDGSVNLARRGMAPEVTMYTYDFGSLIRDDPADPNYVNYLGDLDTAIATHGIHIAANPWGTGGCYYMEFARYTGLAYEIDDIVRGALGRPVTMIFSAGNERDKSIPPPAPETDPSEDNSLCYPDTWPAWSWEYVAPYRNYGTINHPKAAKNVIVVGGVGASRRDENRMMGNSSWGPTADGRIKPDLVASGIVGEDYDAGIIVGGEAFQVPTYRGIGFVDEYGAHHSSSAAAAAVAGGAALLVEAFHRYLPDAGDPAPAALKALLLHTAEDLNDDSSWYNAGPDFASGYGLVQIDNAIETLRRDKLHEGVADAGTSDWYRMEVLSGAVEVKVTLVWDDPAPDPGSASVLVNDLELVVQSPDGTRHFPWTLDPVTPDSPARRDRADHINNVEQVVVYASDYGGMFPPGDWNVYVEGLEVPAGPQPYALVANYALSPADATASVVLGEPRWPSEPDDVTPPSRVLEPKPKRIPDPSDLGPKSLYLVDCPPGPMFFGKFCDPRVNPEHDRFLVVDLKHGEVTVFSRNALGLAPHDGPLFAAAPVRYEDQPVFVATAPYADATGRDSGAIVFFDSHGKPVARIDGQSSGERLGLDMDVRGAEVAAVSTRRFLRIREGKVIQEIPIPRSLHPARAIRVAFTDDVDGDQWPEVLIGTPYAGAGGLEEAGLIQVIGSRSGARIDAIYGRQPGQRLGITLQSIEQAQSPIGK